jgi:transcriptional regulator with XRE-family HTH domain
MTSPESPAGARRRVRLTLREARERLSYTQAQVAEEMEWSTSKVIRIESGEVTISPNDLRPLLAYLKITDKAEIDRLIQDARNSRRRQMWWDEPQVRAHLTGPSRQLIQYEHEATAIRHFTAFIIPGTLQTPAYARATLSSHIGELAESDIETRLQTRKRRRTELFARRDFPQILLLLDESVLKRRAGDARTTGEQLLDLLRVARERSEILVRVLPYTADAPLPMFGQYDILTLPGGDQPGEDAVLYRESHLTDELVEDPWNVSRHRSIFDQYWEAALPEAASADLIAEAAKELLDSASPAATKPSEANSASTPPSRPRRRRTS